jgi:HPr kinase/phosphorylase
LLFFVSQAITVFQFIVIHQKLKLCCVMYRVENLWQEYGKILGLSLEAGQGGLARAILIPEAHRPGLSLSGYIKGHASKRMLVFGKVEVEYLKDLEDKTRIKRLEPILTERTPAVIVARRLKPPKELVALCQTKGIPLFRTSMATMNFMNKLSVLLSDEFSPSISCHGTLVEVFGVGVLIQGDSSVGKSETALGLVERGHRLVADDIVRVRKREGGYLEGKGVQLTRHLMEIRGIGIINVAHLYGAVCIRESKSIEIIVHLETWDDTHHYDRIGLEERFCTILSVPLPFHVLPVKPGRDVVLLLETIALNHRLKQMGINSAQEFRLRQQEAINKRKRSR